MSGVLIKTMESHGPGQEMKSEAYGCWGVGLYRESEKKPPDYYEQKFEVGELVV